MRNFVTKIKKVRVMYKYKRTNCEPKSQSLSKSVSWKK